MKLRGFLGAGLCTLLVLLAWDGEVEASPIAVVNVQRVIDESGLGKRARAEVESRALKQKTELRQLKEELDSFRKQVTQQRELISAEAFEEKGEELTRRERDFQRSLKDSQEELIRLNQERIKGVVEKIDSVVQSVADSRNIKFVFEYEPGFLVYFNKALDITTEVIKSVDKTYGS